MYPTDHNNYHDDDPPYDPSCYYDGDEAQYECHQQYPTGPCPPTYDGERSREVEYNDYHQASRSREAPRVWSVEEHQEATVKAERRARRRRHRHTGMPARSVSDRGLGRYVDHDYQHQHHQHHQDQQPHHRPHQHYNNGNYDYGDARQPRRSYNDAFSTGFTAVHDASAPAYNLKAAPPSSQPSLQFRRTLSDPNSLQHMMSQRYNNNHTDMRYSSNNSNNRNATWGTPTPRSRHAPELMTRVSGSAAAPYVEDEMPVSASATYAAENPSRPTLTAAAAAPPMSTARGASPQFRRTLSDSNRLQQLMHQQDCYVNDMATTGQRTSYNNNNSNRNATWTTNEKAPPPSTRKTRTPAAFHMRRTQSESQHREGKRNSYKAIKSFTDEGSGPCTDADATTGHASHQRAPVRRTSSRTSRGAQRSSSSRRLQRTESISNRDESGFFFNGSNNNNGPVETTQGYLNNNHNTDATSAGLRRTLSVPDNAVHGSTQRNDERTESFHNNTNSTSDYHDGHQQQTAAPSTRRYSRSQALRRTLSVPDTIIVEGNSNSNQNHKDVAQSTVRNRNAANTSDDAMDDGPPAIVEVPAAPPTVAVTAPTTGTAAATLSSSRRHDLRRTQSVPDRVQDTTAATSQDLWMSSKNRHIRKDMDRIGNIGNDDDSVADASAKNKKATATTDAQKNKKRKGGLMRFLKKTMSFRNNEKGSKQTDNKRAGAFQGTQSLPPGALNNIAALVAAGQGTQSLPREALSSISKTVSKQQQQQQPEQEEESGLSLSFKNRQKTAEMDRIGDFDDEDR